MKPKWFYSIWTALAVVLLTGAAPARATEVLTFIHTDVAGSPVAATDINGNVIWREGYRPYGARTKNESAATVNRQFFHGKAFDSDTGLSYFGARYYDPAVGRFMGVDAVGFNEGNIHSFNRYTYGNNNPYKFTDPDGRVVVPVVPLVIGIFSLAYLAYEMHPISMPQVPFNSGVAAQSVSPGEVMGAFAGLRSIAAGASATARGVAANELSTVIPTQGTKFNQLARRGWTQETIDNVVNNPYTTRESINRATGNKATAYSRKDGHHVVRDDVTGEIVQMSDTNIPVGIGKGQWRPDPSIKDPYIP